jgi:hypothetical protein
MGNSRNRYPARRRFLKQSAALSAGAAALATPAIVLGAGRKTPAGDASVASASSNASVAPASGTAPQSQHRGAGNQRSEAEEQSPHKA